MDTIKVGLLLPRSSLYPCMGIDFMNGLKAGLKNSGFEGVAFFTENIGFGMEKDVYTSAEKLLLQQEVTLVVAFINSAIASVLDPLFEAQQCILLVVDTGGHIPSATTSLSSHRFTLSLNAAFGSCLTGRLAAEKGEKRTVFATSFYEGGYQQCHAYQQGLIRAGGVTLGHFITPFKNEQIQIEKLAKEIVNHKPDAILAQFSAEAGASFLNEFTHAHLHELVKLYASPFMLEEEWLSGIPFFFDGISGCVTWSKKLTNTVNQHFLETIKVATGKTATVFSMVGWEASQFIGIVITALDENKGAILQTLSALETISIESPRGLLTLNPEIHTFSSPMYIALITADENKKCELKIEGEVPFAKEEFSSFTNDCVLDSGWTNTYLCI